MPATDSAKIRDIIYKYFQLGKTKDLERIADFFIDDSRFTKFGDSPPYDRRDLERALMLEQLHFASLSDYDFKIEDLKIDILDDNNAAVATFILENTGMVVDDYSFRGTTVSSRSRVTIVLQKDRKDQWKMIHQHLSKFQG